MHSDVIMGKIRGKPSNEIRILRGFICVYSN